TAAYGDWCSGVCSSDLLPRDCPHLAEQLFKPLTLIQPAADLVSPPPCARILVQDFLESRIGPEQVVHERRPIVALNCRQRGIWAVEGRASTKENTYPQQVGAYGLTSDRSVLGSCSR